MRKLTRRAYNRKVLVFGISIFMSIAMISTGFAAWVMSNVTNVNDAEGSVVVSTVSDKVVKITVDQWDGDDWTGAKLVFDSIATDDEGRVRYEKIEGDEDGGQQLILPITVRIDNHGVLTGVEMSVKLPKSIVKAMEAGYIKIDTVAGVAYDASKLSAVDGSEDKVYTCALTPADEITADIVFAWGDYFKGANPCEFYDSEDLKVDRGIEGAAIAGADIPDSQMTTEMKTFVEILQTGATTGVVPTGVHTGTIYINITGITN